MKLVCNYCRTLIDDIPPFNVRETTYTMCRKCRNAYEQRHNVHKNDRAKFVTQEAEYELPDETGSD